MPFESLSNLRFLPRDFPFLGATGSVVSDSSESLPSSLSSSCSAFCLAGGLGTVAAGDWELIGLAAGLDWGSRRLTGNCGGCRFEFRTAGGKLFSIEGGQLLLLFVWR